MKEEFSGCKILREDQKTIWKYQHAITVDIYRFPAIRGPLTKVRGIGGFNGIVRATFGRSTKGDSNAVVKHVLRYLFSSFVVEKQVVRKVCSSQVGQDPRPAWGSARLGLSQALAPQGLGSEARKQLLRNNPRYRSSRILYLATGEYVTWILWIISPITFGPDISDRWFV